MSNTSSASINSQSYHPFCCAKIYALTSRRSDQDDILHVFAFRVQSRGNVTRGDPVVRICSPTLVREFLWNSKHIIRVEKVKDSNAPHEIVTDTCYFIDDRAQDRCYVEVSKQIIYQDGNEGVKWLPAGNYVKFRCAEHSDGDSTGGAWYLTYVLKRELNKNLASFSGGEEDKKVTED